MDRGSQDWVLDPIQNQVLEANQKMRTLRILLLSAVSALCALAQAPVISAVTNGLSYSTQMSPGVLATVFGSSLSGNNQHVRLNGVDCPITYSSDSQVNIQIPWEAATGKGHVVVAHDGMSSSPFAVTISPYSPALSSYDGGGSGTGVFFSGANLITSTNPANGGDTLSTYGVGLGATNPAIATGEITPNPPPLYVTLATPTITVGGKATSILFSGLAPGFLATDQINFTLAPDTPTGTRTVVVKIGKASTNQITIPIGCLDVTGKVSVALGPLTHQSGSKYSQKVTVTNMSGTALAAKASVVLTNLSSTSQLSNGGGASCPSSDGSPYRSTSFTGAGAAQTATVTLSFTDSTGNISYGVRVLDK